MGNFVLEVNNLTKVYGDRVAVNNVSFEIFKGEIFGFIGPNGAGKTTTIKMIVGLAHPSAGTIKICGFSLTSQFEKAIANVGGIIENPELYSYMSGLDNLKYYASLYKGITIDKIKEVVKLVGMENRIKDKVRTYSLGMRQRIGIAQALLHDPKLLILDEPTNGLDPSGIQEMRMFLKKLAHEQKISILISSHILSEMEQLCDTIAIIDNGKIIEIKQIDEIIKGLEESNKVSIKVDYPNYAGKLIMNNLKVEVQVAGNSIIFPLEENLIPKATSILIAKNISIYGISNIKKSLEEVFLEILNKSKNSSASVAIL
ncbi:MAG: ABC transporter ATP-binding protein [Spirochaetales bacterium]